MATERPNATQELVFRNVSYHRRGKPEFGKLYLTQHHLIFSYVPSAGTTRTVSSQQSSSLSSSSNLAEDARKVSAQSTSTPAAIEKAPDIAAKTRPKQIYVPYPLIHNCTLRPSTAAIVSRAPSTAQSDARQDSDELFPPTYGTSSYARPSTDSLRPESFTPRRAASPYEDDISNGNARPPAIRIRCKDFVIFALHFHGSKSKQSADDESRQVLYALRERCCVSSIEDMYAFHFQPPAEESATGGQPYNPSKEFARMGIDPTITDGAGVAWRTTEINSGWSYSQTYPALLCVPQPISDNILKYGASFRSKARIPALTYLHPNGGSITRSSQPMGGVANKRSPQDEKLVKAIFSSHTPSGPSPEDSPQLRATSGSHSTTSLPETNKESSDWDLPKPSEAVAADTPARRIYGSTRRNLIVDARPRINVIANKATGGGIENPTHYTAGSNAPVSTVFLNIANIHVMRHSLEEIVKALGSSDYLDLAPNQDLLAKSGWLGHIAGILDGAEMVARVVGLGASHALIHCSDGWDRTSQISALAQVMLDPHYRTLEGFITLVQKDFLSFGHKFGHRQGVEGSEKWFSIENERMQSLRSKENGIDRSIQAFGSKAMSGARAFFEKGKSTISGQKPPAKSSRPTTPPANPVIHSIPSPSPSQKDDKHHMSESEVSPVFHQFLDSVYQLLYQDPTAFEFNERFLRRLLYQSYSGQYGEFLFNNEKERAQNQTRTPSVWANFLARRQEFTNQDYTPRSDDQLLFPRRVGLERDVEVRWWHTVFGCKNEEMNVERALVRESTNTPQMAATLLDEEDVPLITEDHKSTDNNTLRSARSTPALASTVVASHSASDVPGANTGPQATSLLTSSVQNTTIASSDQQRMNDRSFASLDMDEGDPLGVSTKPATAANIRKGLDFAAFAQQNAFSER